MKKMGWIVSVVVCVMVLLVAVLAVVGSLRDRQLMSRDPLTIQDLDRLAGTLNGRMNRPSASENDASVLPRHPAQTTASEEDPAATQQNHALQSSDAERASTALPRRLERTATPEERAKRWGHKTGTGKLAASFASPALSILDAALYATGRSGGMAWERAQAMLVRGDWSGARSCLAEYLETSRRPVARRDACAYLAWLEDDPEVAARYMELACSDEDDLRGGCLAISEELARLTGSDALADHYRARLQDVLKRRDDDW